MVAQMREARQEDKVQVVLTLRFAGAAAYRSREFWRDLLQPEKRGSKGGRSPPSPASAAGPASGPPNAKHATRRTGTSGQ